jgi:hypothetical protein
MPIERDTGMNQLDEYVDYQRKKTITKYYSLAAV